MKGDIFMEKQNLWNLFKETGKIEYYIKYKMLEGKSDTLGDNRS